MHRAQEAREKRYSKNYHLGDERMLDRGHDLLLLPENGALLVVCIMGLLLQRFGAKRMGRIDN